MFRFFYIISIGNIPGHKLAQVPVKIFHAIREHLKAHTLGDL